MSPDRPPVESEHQSSSPVLEQQDLASTRNYTLADMQSALAADRTRNATTLPETLTEFAIVGDGSKTGKSDTTSNKGTENQKFDRATAVTNAAKLLNQYSWDGPPIFDGKETIKSTLKAIRASDGNAGIDAFVKDVNAQLRYGLEFRANANDTWSIGPSKERTSMIRSVQESLSEREIGGPPVGPDNGENIRKTLQKIKKEGGAAAVDEFCHQVNSKTWTGFELRPGAGDNFVIGPSKEKMATMQRVADLVAKESNGQKLTSNERGTLDEVLGQVLMSPDKQLARFNRVVTSMLPEGIQFEAKDDLTYKATDTRKKK